MSNVSVNISKIKKYINKLKSLGEYFNEARRKALVSGANVGIRCAKQNSSFARGYLKNKWEANSILKKDITNSAKYASLVNYGRKLIDKKLKEEIKELKRKNYEL